MLLLSGDHHPEQLSRLLAAGPVARVTAAELHAQLEDIATIIDVRSEVNWICSGHIPCAHDINLPLDKFLDSASSIDELDLNLVTPTLETQSAMTSLQNAPRAGCVGVVADDTDGAVRAAGFLAAEMGFTQVVALEGGFATWSQAGLPVEYGTDCETIHMHCPWLEGSDNGPSLDTEDVIEELIF